MDSDTIQMPERENLTIIDGVYVLTRKLGQGGMAAVYLAEVDLLRFDYTSLYAYTQVQGDSHLERRRKAEELAGRLSGQTLDPGTVRSLLVAQGIPVPGAQVALKVAIGEADTARFEVEWKSLLCLNHPNVIQVYGGGKHLGRPYYAMELLNGIVPPKRVKAEFTIAQKLQVIIQAARGLAYLHANGIVHRDVKPDNAVVCETLPGEFVTKIADLGIAKEVEAAGMTLTQTAMGTPNYMSPEQFASSKHVDQRADIYSLGATLYELVAGVKPYHDKTTVFELLQAISLHTLPLPVTQHNPELPEPVAGIVECAMAWDAACRYQKMEELIKDIERYLADEHAAVTRAVTFSAGSKAKSVARIGKDKYAFERYRRKAALRAAVPQAPLAAAAAAAAAKPVTMARVAGPKKPRPTLLISSGIAVAAAALILGLVIAYQAANRPPPRRPAATVTPAPAKPLAVNPVQAIKPPTVPTPVPAPAVTGEAATLIANLHAALKAKNPEYNGKGKFTVESGRIVEANLVQCGIVDLSPLRGLPLRKLNLQQNWSLTDLRPLEGMPLEYLILWGCAALRDLRPLAGMRLKELNLSACERVDNLEPLRGMPSLGILYLSARKDLDLSPLADSRIESLMIFCAQYTPSLAALRNLPLRTLTLHNGRLPDLSPLSGKTLEVFAVTGFQERDLSALGNLSCKQLRLGNCPNLVDLAALKNVQALEWLSLNITGVTDLSCLAGTKLKILSFHESPIRDLAFVKNLPNLEELYVFSAPPVTDLTPLAGLKLKKLAFTLASVTKGIEAVRGMTTLTEIRPDAERIFTPAEFWKKYDAGEFGKPGSTATLAPAPASVVTGADAALIANLHAALKAKNPEYNGKADIKVKNGKITEVVLTATGVRDLSPLRGLALTGFACNYERVTDLSPLQGQPLTILRLSGTQVWDLTPLKGMRLSGVSIGASPVQDLAPLRGMPMAALSLFSLTELSSLEPLHGMTTLAYLDIRFTRVQDLRPLEGMKLNCISFTPANITAGIEVLRNMPSLQRLSGGEHEPVPVAEFWKRYDAGEFGKPGTAVPPP